MKKILVVISIIFLMATLTVFANNNNFTVKEGFITLPQGKIWYKIYSSEKVKNNIPLLIIHGGPGATYNYLEVLNKLAKDRPVIFYDQLGCGHSEISKNDPTLWSMQNYVEELSLLVDALQLTQFHLLGHSWGGSLAIEYALKNPTKIISLTLASPLISTPLWIADAKRLLLQLPPTLQQAVIEHEPHGTDSKEYQQAVELFYRQHLCRMKEWPIELKYSLDHINMDIYQTMWGSNEFSATGNLKDFDRMEDLKQLTMPVLITGGKFDEATPHTLKKAVKLLPNGKLIIYKKSAHVALLEEEEKYLHDLRSFLRYTTLASLSGSYHCTGKEINSHDNSIGNMQIHQTGQTYSIQSQFNDGSSYLGTGIYDSIKNNFSIAFYNPKKQDEIGIASADIKENHSMNIKWSYLHKNIVSQEICIKLSD